MMTGAEPGPDRRLPKTLNRKSAMRETRATGLLVQNLSVELSTVRALRLAAIALGIGLVMTVSAARAGSDDDDNRSFERKNRRRLQGRIRHHQHGQQGHRLSRAIAAGRAAAASICRRRRPPPAEANAPNWPKDPDEKRRKAALAARKKNRKDLVESNPSADAGDSTPQDGSRPRGQQRPAARRSGSNPPQPAAARFTEQV